MFEIVSIFLQLLLLFHVVVTFLIHELMLDGAIFWTLLLNRSIVEELSILKTHFDVIQVRINSFVIRIFSILMSSQVIDVVVVIAVYFGNVEILLHLQLLNLLAHDLIFDETLLLQVDFRISMRKLLFVILLLFSSGEKLI